MPKEHQKFVISQKGILMRAGKCLIMKIRLVENDRASLKWDLPGGRVDVRENVDDAFVREIKEETGLIYFRDLGVVGYKSKVPRDSDKFPPFCGIIRLIENEKDPVKMSFEHIEMRWITEAEVNDYNYCWEDMPEMIKKGFELYKKVR